MPGLSSASGVLVQRAVPEDLWHERMIIGHLGSARYLVLMPDLDPYEENYDPHNDDIEAARVIVDGAVPPDLENEPLYTFEGPIDPGDRADEGGGGTDVASARRRRCLGADRGHDDRSRPTPGSGGTPR